MKKYALVLSGGGFKGAYQYGALKYIDENWGRITGLKTPMKFNLIAGVSVGALNGIMLAMNKMDTLKGLWNDVIDNGGSSIYSSEYIDEKGKIGLNFQELKRTLFPGFRIGPGLISKALINSIGRTFNKRSKGFLGTILSKAENDFDKAFRKFKSFASNEPLAAKIRQHVRLKHIRIGTTFICGIVSIKNGKYYALTQHDFDSDNDFAKAILASTAMPIIWPPVKNIITNIEGLEIKESVDGGIRNVSPLGDIVDHINMDDDTTNNYHVIIINCNSGNITELEQANYNIADIALRTLTEITLAEVFCNDIKEFLRINDLVKQAIKRDITLMHKKRPLKYFDYTLIQPNTTLGDTLDASAEMIIDRIESGYMDASIQFNK